MNHSSPTSAATENSCVLFREIATKDGLRLGFAQLNAEKPLNALSLDMIGCWTCSCGIGPLQQRMNALDLADVLRLELIVALLCCARPDLAAGIRALLIDKDNKPRWQPATVSNVTPRWIDEHFAAPAWPGSEHPLADL